MASLADQVRAVRALARSGMFEPGLMGSMALSVATGGATIAAPYAAAARRFPARVALIDDVGPLTYHELNRRSDEVAGGLKEHGVHERDRIGILCRNHRGYIEAMIAAAKLGCATVALNTDFSGRQLSEVVEREGITLLLHDADHGAAASCPVESVPIAPGATWSFPGLEPGSAPRRRPRAVPPPVLLTSGTTGTPKGARRDSVSPDPAAVGAIFDAIPYRRGDVMVISPPLFHAWASSQTMIAAALAGTIILRQHFNAAQTLTDLAEHAARTLITVPVMMTRILEIADPADLPMLEIVASSGSALPGHLAHRWMDTFGDTLYNFYGSTEVGQATVATPSDLRLAPGTAGQPMLGTEVAVLGEDDKAVVPGVSGRIFVGSSLGFDGYTGGADKQRIGSLVSIGDVGYFDDAGRLFVTGRDDDMIISGGENLFPAEVEGVLADHPDVADVAVIGVDDDEFGQRLAAYVVKRPGSKMTKQQVRDHVRAELARFKVPRDVIWTKTIPRNPTGKVRRRELESRSG